MTAAPVQAPAPPTWRTARGLVFVRMRPYRLGLSDGSQRPGVVLNVMRDGDAAPPFLAEAWRQTGGKWCEDFGGRHVVRDRRLAWEWTC